MRGLISSFVLFALWIAFTDTTIAADLGSPVPVEQRVTDLEKRVTNIEKSLSPSKGCPCDDCKCPDGKCPACPTAVITDALDEVNAWRVANGFRPFARDHQLTMAAWRCANVRARTLTFGHTENDFAALPEGATASATGCAAYPPSYGWLSCCMGEDADYGGASYVMGVDGKRYMHLFVRKEASPVAVAGQRCGPNGCSLGTSGGCSNCATASPTMTTTRVQVSTSTRKHPIRNLIKHIFRRG